MSFFEFNMMRKYLTAVLFVLLGASMSAQYKWDYGISLGSANYLGDIGGEEKTRRDGPVDVHLDRTAFSAGAYGRYKFSKRFALQTSFDFVRIKDADSYSTNPARRARNLNFRNDMFELGLKGQYTIFYDADVGGRGYYNPDFKLYVFGGVSTLYHNPKAQWYEEGELMNDGEWYDLRPLKTEGQTEEYSKFVVAIPVGLGMYFTFDKVWRVGMELSWRTTFTDYLDDVSTTYGNPDNMSEMGKNLSSQAYQALIDEIGEPELSGKLENHQYTVNPNNPEDLVIRGNPTHNDSYFTTQITLGRVIKGRSSFYRKKYSWMKHRTGSKRSKAKF